MRLEFLSTVFPQLCYSTIRRRVASQRDLRQRMTVKQTRNRSQNLQVSSTSRHSTTFRQAVRWISVFRLA